MPRLQGGAMQSGRVSAAIVVMARHWSKAMAKGALDFDLCEGPAKDPGDRSAAIGCRSSPHFQRQGWPNSRSTRPAAQQHIFTGKKTARHLKSARKTSAYNQCRTVSAPRL